MTVLDVTVVQDLGAVRARPARALRDVVSIAGRALRAVPRELETVIPPIFIALFFFVVNIGTLQHITERHINGFDINGGFWNYVLATILVWAVNMLVDSIFRDSPAAKVIRH